jgi:hypothetical protein
MSAYFWNSGSQPPPPAAGGGAGGGGYHPGFPYDTGHWGGGGGPTFPGGAVPPTLNAAGQALLGQMQQGPLDRINEAGLGPLWQQLGMSAAPTPGGMAGAGYASSSSPQHSPVYNVTGGGTATASGWPPGHMFPGGNPGGPPVGGPGQPVPQPYPYPNPPTQDGPMPSPQQLSAFQQYIMRRWPGWNPGWNQGPPGAQ